jgi:hypothetical protein
LPATSLMAPLLLAIPLSWSPLSFRRLQSRMIPEVEKVFQAGSCAKNTALIQAGSEAGNMNQGLVPAGFFAFGVGTIGLGKWPLRVNRPPQSARSGP